MKTSRYIAFHVAVSIAGVVHAQTDAIPVPGENGAAHPINALLPCEPETEGWKLLFDGSSRESFADNFLDWKKGDSTESGSLSSSWQFSESNRAIITTESNGYTNDIRSKFLVRDFDLRLSYKNSSVDGIFYKAMVREERPWATGMMFAVNDDIQYVPLNRSVGAGYGLIDPESAAAGAYRPWTPDHTNADTWNFVRIVQKGDSVEHWLNNVKVLGYRFWNSQFESLYSRTIWAATNDLAQNSKGCKCQVIEGYLGFQGDYPGNWLLRNIRYTSQSQHVKLGPVQLGGCSASEVRPEVGGMAGAFQKRTGGFRFFFPQGGLHELKVFGLDGRPAGRSIVDEQGFAASVEGLVGPGIYFFRAYDSRNKPMLSQKIAIP